MSQNIFYKTLDYLSGADISRNINTLRDDFEEEFPVKEGIIDYSRDAYIGLTRLIDNLSFAFTSFFPNALDAIAITNSVSENRIPYEILAIEAGRVSLRLLAKTLINKMQD